MYSAGHRVEFENSILGSYWGTVTAKEGEKFVIHWDDEPSNPFVFGPSCLTAEEIKESLVK